MRRFFGRKQENNIILEDGEFIHLKKVLRMTEGEKVIASINDENDYYCTIAQINKNDCILDIDEVVFCPANPTNDITLFQMMPKKDYFDNILPKAIELGISKLIPFKSEYTMNKILKRERVDSQVMTACKQCERSRLIDVEDIIPFDTMLSRLNEYDCVIFAYENATHLFSPEMVKNKRKIAVIVGNEAGFTETEAQAIQNKGAASISLGKSILRCDTAVVATLALVSVLSQK